MASLGIALPSLSTAQTAQRLVHAEPLDQHIGHRDIENHLGQEGPHQRGTIFEWATGKAVPMVHEGLYPYQFKNRYQLFVPLAQWPKLFFKTWEKLALNAPPAT